MNRRSDIIKETTSREIDVCRVIYSYLAILYPLQFGLRGVLASFSLLRPAFFTCGVYLPRLRGVFDSFPPLRPAYFTCGAYLQLLRGVFDSFSLLRPALPARHNRKSHPYNFRFAVDKQQPFSTEKNSKKTVFQLVHSDVHNMLYFVM